MRAPPPLALWLGGILLLVALLAVIGGFGRPVAIAVLIVAALVGFVVARYGRRS